MTMSVLSFHALADDGRSSERLRVRLGAIWLDRKAGEHELTVLNISATGFLLETEEPLSENSSIIVQLPDGVYKVCRIVWCSGSLRGAVFSEPLSDIEFQRIIVEFQQSIVGNLEHLPGREHQTLPKAEYGPANDQSCEFEYSEVGAHEKLPFAERVRIIFGSATLLWAMVGGLAWSAAAAMS